MRENRSSGSFAKGFLTAIVIVFLGIGTLVGGCVAVAGAADDIKTGTDGYVTIDQVVKKNTQNISALDKRVTAIEDQLSEPALAASSARLKMPDSVSSEIVTVTASEPIVESVSSWSESPPIVVSSGGWGAGNVSGGSTGTVRSSWSSSRVSAGSTGNVPIVRYTSPIRIASPPIVVSSPTQVYAPRPAPATPLRSRLRSPFVSPPTSCRIVNGRMICN